MRTQDYTPSNKGFRLAVFKWNVSLAMVFWMLSFLVPLAAEQNPGTTLWVNQYPTTILKLGIGPAVDEEGRVFSQLGKTLLALDGKTGRELWRFEAEVLWSSQMAVGSNEVLYAGATDNKLYAFSAKYGFKLWEFETGGDVNTKPAVSNRGTVYIGSGDGKVYALDGGSGRKLWEFQTGGWIGWTAPVVGNNGLVYCGSSDRKMYALNQSTGQKVWEFTTGAEILYSEPAIGTNGILYFGSNDTRIYALNGQTGQRIWALKSGGALSSSPAVSKDGTVYFAAVYKAEREKDDDLEDFLSDFVTDIISDFIFDNEDDEEEPEPNLPIPKDGGLYAVDGQTGEILWSRATNNGYTSPVLDQDGSLYFQPGGLFFLDGKSGETLWASSGASLSGKPALGPDGTIYTHWSHQNQLYAVKGLQTKPVDTGTTTPSLINHMEDRTLYTLPATLNGEWVTNLWIGPYNFPYGKRWLYHLHHGWLYYPQGQGAYAVWFWDQELGWVWLNIDHYPYIFSKDMGWLYYQMGSVDPRRFFHYQTREWMEVGSQ